MDSSNITTLLIITCIIISIGAIVATIVIINKQQKRKYQKIINDLERDKNLIVSANVLSELKKVDNLVNNDAIRQLQANFQKRFEDLKNIELPKITDDLIELEDLFDHHKYKELEPKLAKIELCIYYAKTKSYCLLAEIKEITLSEEKNRERVTKLKTIYREAYTKYHNNKLDYELIDKPIEL